MSQNQTLLKSAYTSTVDNLSYVKQQALDDTITPNIRWLA